MKLIGIVLTVALLGVLGALGALHGCSDAGKKEAMRGQKSTTILFTGDVMLDRGVAEQMRRHGWDWPWRSVDSLFHAADAVVVNLECPVTERWEPVNKQYIFRASPAALPAMAKAGVTHATLANNHTMDQGHGGLADTDSLLRQNGITPLGYGHKPQAVFVNNSANMPIAIISALMMPVENWTFASAYDQVCCTSTDSLVAAVTTFKAQHPTARLVLCLHWGAEYQPRCTPRQRLDAHRLIDAGADAIVGHHPHVVQNNEIYHGRPIHYSLGNFIFDNPRPETHRTAILSLTFTPDTIISRLYPLQMSAR